MIHVLKKQKGRFLFSLYCMLVCLILFVLPPTAESASLYLTPASKSQVVGTSFVVNVMVNSGGVPINAAEGVLKFNPSEFEVISLSKNNSIFNLWVEDPTFSNSSGFVNFAGGTTSSFNGTSGTVIQVTFRMKSVGSGFVTLPVAAVLADDFQGTNILTSVGSGKYTVEVVEVTPVVDPVAPTYGGVGPTVSSPTHPNPESWYANTSPTFTWKIPSGTTGTRLLVNQSSSSTPTVFYSEHISEKQLEDIDEGISYFHIQLQNNEGWGRVSHFKFQIDTEPPQPFKIEIQEGSETTNPQPTLLFNTTDETSGVEYYEIIIDNKETIRTERSEYKIPAQDLGPHTLIVKAVDRAGNETLAMTEIEILPIESLVITDHPKELTPGSIFSIRGTALPESTVRVYLQKDKEEVKVGETKTDEEGRWLYIEVEPMKKGVYHVWAEVIDSTGAKSNPSEKLSVLVSPPVFIRIGEVVIDYLTTIITLLVLITSLILGVIWGLLKIKEKKMRIAKEVHEAASASTKTFEALNAELLEQIAKLDGKSGLSEKEEKVYDDLKKALKISEKFIGKEIEDIKKEIKGK